MKRIITFLIALLCSVLMFGQVTLPIMTPEAATLGRFGAYPISYYTGTPDVTVPLHTLKVHDIEIPIYLQYEGRGFIPNRDSGKVGHDWTLVAGGLITRSVKGIADEMEKYVEVDSYESNTHLHNNGLLYGIREIDKQHYDNQGIKTLSEFNSSNKPQNPYELEPDMFTFHFGKHQGQFVISYDGSVKVNSDEQVKVDISSLQNQKIDSFPQRSSIVITTDDGTKFTFGGDVSALEISLYLTYDLPGHTLKSNFNGGTITAFYLSEIETIDGEKISFSYLPALNASNSFQDDPTIIKSRYCADFQKGFINREDGGTYLNSETEPQFAATKGAFLSSIKSSAGKVLFNYQTKNHPFCLEMRNWGQSTSYRLDNIQIYNNQGTLIKGIQLHQSFVGSKWMNKTTYRMFLNSLNIGKDVYKFAYSDTTRLPLPWTRGIDLQGYYNGKDENTSLLPSHYGINAYDVAFQNRDPNPQYGSKAMLKSITYPTGGRTEFEFEGHRYGTIMYYDLGMISDRESEGAVGGLRVKTIRNIPGDTLYYSYQNESGSSTGVFNNLKRYAYYLADDAVIIEQVSSYDNILAPNSVYEPEIVYSRVTEKRGTGNGKKTYTYTTFSEFPDQTNLGPMSEVYFRNNKTENNQDLLRSMKTLTSLAIERGKLTEVSEFDNHDLLLRHTAITYSRDNHYQDSAVYAATSNTKLGTGEYMINSYANYYYYVKPGTRVVTEYKGAPNLVTTTQYKYNNKNKQPSQISVSNSDGTVYRTEYTYPTDYAVEPYRTMQSRFQLSPIVTEKQFAGTVPIKSRSNSYQLYHNKFYALSSVKEGYGGGTEFETVGQLDYDPCRNVVNIKQIGKPVTSFIWGYKRQHPVAQLENVSYYSLKTRYPNIDALSADSVGHSDMLSGMRALFPNAPITTYEYKPGVGITEIGEPNRLTHQYTYDSQNRLNSQKTDSKPVWAINYHSLNQTVPLTAAFSGNQTSFEQKPYAFSLSVQGGSGNYTYAWSLKRADGSVVALGQEQRWNIDLASIGRGTYTLSCKINDQIVNDELICQKTITVLPFGIEFGQVQYSSVSDDHAQVTAQIVCKEPVQVTFTLEYEVPAAQSNTGFDVTVNSYTYSGQGRGQKTFTVMLNTGINDVSLNLNHIITEGNLYLGITNVASTAYTIGANSSISLTY